MTPRCALDICSRNPLWTSFPFLRALCHTIAVTPVRLQVVAHTMSWKTSATLQVSQGRSATTPSPQNLSHLSCHPRVTMSTSTARSVSGRFPSENGPRHTGVSQLRCPHVALQCATKPESGKGSTRLHKSYEYGLICISTELLGPTCPRSSQRPHFL